MTDNGTEKKVKMSDLLSFDGEITEDLTDPQLEASTPHGPRVNAAIHTRSELPAFNKEDLDFWFLMVESDFRAAKITDDDIKFNDIMRALDRTTARQLSDVLRDPPAENKYEYLKKVILDRFKNTRQAELHKLLEEMVLGDKRPSELLREMKNLAKDSLSDEVLHELWLKRLPQKIAPLLEISDTITLNALAEIADRVMLRMKEPTIMATSHVRKPSDSLELTSIKETVNELKRALTSVLQELEDMRAERRSRSRHRSFSKASTTRSSSPHSNGKRSTLPTIGAVDGSDNNNNTISSAEPRLHIFDKSTKLTFLIDSGAVVSIIPAEYFRGGRSQAHFTLYAANSSQISTYGTKTLEPNFNLRRPFPWAFIIADVDTPIVGADFLAHYDLLIDLKNKQLIDSTTSLSTKGKLRQTQFLGISTVSSDINCSDLLKEFISITKPSENAITPSKMEFAHRIPTTGPPVSERYRKISGDKAVAAKTDLQDLLRRGKLRPSSSSWASAIHVVQKSEKGCWRTCGDFRKLNAVTEPDKYAPPQIQSLFPLLHKKTNASQTFQRFIDSVFRDLDCVFVYIDDILVISENEQQHRSHLRQVFKKLQDHALSINVNKYIVYVKGEENVVADALSRINAITMPSILDAQTIQQAQEADQELPEILESQISINLQEIEVEPNVKIYCDITHNIVRPYIPESLRRLHLTLFIIYHIQVAKLRHNNCEKNLFGQV
ncbi:uncharacterized protein [Chelonus insularis]|uniref:uncharacterized protein n=1 Tax=Chelonus insularis TaxID=460826 RepID=UPI00158ACFFE|nr:uncharacterized protein LOC118070826 [Chelonus insularis]